MNYNLSMQIGRVLLFAEFWIFVALKEAHILSWSWWWLVAFQVAGMLGVLVDQHKAKNL